MCINVLWHTHVRHMSFSRVLCTGPDSTYSYAWHDSSICVPRLIHMCDTTHPHVGHDSLSRVINCARFSWTGSFVFDPVAWQCCNSLADGRKGGGEEEGGDGEGGADRKWSESDYQLHACIQCKTRRRDRLQHTATHCITRQHMPPQHTAAQHLLPQHTGTLPPPPPSQIQSKTDRDTEEDIKSLVHRDIGVHHDTLNATDESRLDRDIESMVQTNLPVRPPRVRSKLSDPSNPSNPSNLSNVGYSGLRPPRATGGGEGRNQSDRFPPKLTWCIVWTRHATHTVWMSHVTYMNESCHI